MDSSAPTTTPLKYSAEQDSRDDLAAPAGKCANNEVCKGADDHVQNAQRGCQVCQCAAEGIAVDGKGVVHTEQKDNLRDTALYLTITQRGDCHAENVINGCRHCGIDKGFDFTAHHNQYTPQETFSALRSW